MKIYTSYYAKIARNPRGLIPVRISTSIPSWFPYVCEELFELYPGWDLVNGIKNGMITKEQYITTYTERLKRINKGALVSKLQQISLENNSRDIVLLCYEAPEEFCHRHLVAKWLNLGVEELS